MNVGKPALSRMFPRMRTPPPAPPRPAAAMGKRRPELGTRPPCMNPRVAHHAPPPPRTLARFGEGFPIRGTPAYPLAPAGPGARPGASPALPSEEPAAAAGRGGAGGGGPFQDGAFQENFRKLSIENSEAKSFEPYWAGAAGTDAGACGTVKSCPRNCAFKFPSERFQLDRQENEKL